MNNTSAPKPVDAVTRELALDPARSFCVTAPAGSGKTELLSQRVLKLLAQAQQPEEILAITFTRKAAAEMQERILAALQHARVANEPQAEHKRHTWRLARAALDRDNACGWNLLQNPTRLRVMTIDGLCASLTRQLPVLSTFGGSVAITDDAAALYRAAVAELLDVLEMENAAADALADLLLHLDNDGERLQRLLVGLLANRDQWMRHIGLAQGGWSEAQLRASLEATLRAVVVDTLTKTTERLRVYQGDLLPLLDYAGTCMQKENPDDAIASLAGCTQLPACDSQAAPLWLALTRTLLTSGDDWRKQVDKRCGFPAGEKAEDKKLCKARKESMLQLLDAMRGDHALLEALLSLRHLPDAQYSESQWQILRQLMLLLPLLAAQLKVIFQQRGEVDYTEVAQAALYALGEAENPGELMLRLDARIRHILVDEFQDTSSSQFQLLEKLLEGWQEHNATDESQQTLFIVGDGMQSIYGFRAANVGLFLGARRRGINGVLLDDAPLRVNFRSTPTIVGWVNQVFERAFPGEEKIARGAVRYEASTAFNANVAGSEVRVLGIGDDPDRQREAAHCVTLVKQALSAPAAGNIAILVRNRSHLRAIIPALSAAAINWRAADIDPLSTRTAVRDLLTLFKALMNLADRIAWLALLRSPLIGLANADLLHVVAGLDGAGVRRSVWTQMQDLSIRSALNDDARAALQRAIDSIAPALALRARKNIRSWLEGVWLSLGGPLCLSGDDDWRDIQVLLDLIENLGPDADIATLQTRVDQLYAQPPAQNAARLWLMTIHKSKGLEFDTVIIPGLERAPRSDDKSLLLWGEYLDNAGASGLVLAASPAFGAGDDAIYGWLDYERKQKQQLEDTRLLYVAATRAIRCLYLLFCDNRKADDKPFAPGSRSLLARIWPAVADSVLWPAREMQPIPLPHIDAGVDDCIDDRIDDRIDDCIDDRIESSASADRLLRVPPAWRLPHTSESPASTTQTDNLPTFEEIAVSDDAVIGTQVHKLLEQCVRVGADAWQQRDADAQRGLIVMQLRQAGILAEKHAEMAAKIQRAVNTALLDQRGQWLLSSAHAFSEVEWELSARDGRRVRIDRSFVDESGTRWIIDYKTAEPFAGETLEKFLARECEVHRAQLLMYRETVAALAESPIKTALYFPCVPAWCEI